LVVATKILQIGYYAELVKIRQMLLAKGGYDVASALGNDQAISLAASATFDLVVVGFSSDYSTRSQMIRWLKQNVPAPVVALLAHNAESFPDADYQTTCETPEVWLTAVANCANHR
jgi:DNA-binding NarL/FixJ family response regulator